MTGFTMSWITILGFLLLGFVIMDGILNKGHQCKPNEERNWITWRCKKIKVREN
jgi:hypothetical protein